MGVSARGYFEDDPIVVSAARDLDATDTAFALRRGLPNFPYAAVLVFFAPELGPATVLGRTIFFTVEDENSDVEAIQI